jgi:small-conductance mechanosensitive channel
MQNQPSFTEALADQTVALIERLGSLAVDIGKTHISLLDVLHGALMLVAVFWFVSSVMGRIENSIRRSSLSYSARELIVKFTKVFLYFTAFVLALSAVGIDLTAFAVFGGALGVGLGLGLQKITANFVSGVTLLLEKSVKLGDLIQVGDLQGFVRAMNIRYTLIETAKGTEVLIPNETLTTTNVINWTLSNAKGRVEVVLTVPYDAPIERVKALLLGLATAHPKALKDPEPNCFLKTFRDSGVEFQLVFWVADVADGLQGPQSEVMTSIVEAFKREEISFAQVHERIG